MSNLIQVLLASSRIYKISIGIEKLGLGSLVAGVLGRFQPELRKRLAQVDVREPLPCVPARIVALDQVYVNLIYNALKSVAPGIRPEIRIPAKKHADCVRLWAQDNGISISPEQ